MIDLTGTTLVPKEKTAAALGLFDGLHIGHREVVKRALAFSDSGISPAVFTFETHTVTSKGDGGVDAILSRELKFEFLEKLGARYVYSPDFNEVKNLSPKEFVQKVLKEKLNAAAAICGSDFRFGFGGTAGAHELKKLCEPFGIEAIEVPPVKLGGEIVSSTRIRAYIRDGKIEKANELLGYEFQLLLPVVHGNELGRTINFPTINQRFSEKQVIPRFGVYLSRTEIEGETWDSITNIGIKPTVGGEAFPLAETHIIGFSGDLYGKTARVSLRAFIRPEMKFSGLESLSAQIASDINKANELMRKGK